MFLLWVWNFYAKNNKLIPLNHTFRVKKTYLLLFSLRIMNFFFRVQTTSHCRPRVRRGRFVIPGAACWSEQWYWNNVNLKYLERGRTQYPAVSVQPAASEVCLQISSKKSSLTLPSVSSYTLLFVSGTSWRLILSPSTTLVAAPLRDQKPKPGAAAVKPVAVLTSWTRGSQTCQRWSLFNLIGFRPLRPTHTQTQTKQFFVVFFCIFWRSVFHRGVVNLSLVVLSISRLAGEANQLN